MESKVDEGTTGDKHIDITKNKAIIEVHINEKKRFEKTKILFFYLLAILGIINLMVFLLMLISRLVFFL